MWATTDDKGLLLYYKLNLWAKNMSWQGNASVICNGPQGLRKPFTVGFLMQSNKGILVKVKTLDDTVLSSCLWMK